MYSVTLWDALKFEVLAVQEEDLAVESLNALSEIARKFAQNAEGPLNAFLRPVIKECNEHLEDAPTKQSQSAGRILHAVASASPAVADRVAKGVLPVLFDLFKASESITKRRGLIEVLNQIIRACVELAAAGLIVTHETLQAFATDMVDATTRALNNAPTSEVSFRLASLEGLELLVAVPKVLDGKEVGRAVDTVTSIILHERVQGHGDIRSQAVKTLTRMASNAPDAVRDRAVPAFMVELPDLPTDSTAYAPALEAFAQLSVEGQIFDTLVLRLKNKLKAARHQGASEAYQHSLLVAMLYAFTYGSPKIEEGAIRGSYYSDYAEPLMEDLHSAASPTKSQVSFEVIGRLCNVLLRSQTIHFQSAAYYKNLRSMVPRATDADTVKQQLRIMAPFALYYYAALRPEIVTSKDVSDQLQLQADLINTAAKINQNLDAVFRSISLTVNKFIDPKAMQATLTSSQFEVESLLSGTPTSSKISLAFAVVKGLIIQGKCAPLTSRYLQLLLQLLPRMSKASAKQFGNLLQPDDILTKENHCVISGLYKQKTFNQTVPSLVEAVRTADAASKANYLIALSGVLKWLPYSVIQPSLITLVPALLQALDLAEQSEQEVKVSTLTIFESCLMHDPTLVTDHTASLITRLLNSTTAPANNAIVRASALQCLALVPKQLKREAVVPYRRQVVKRLMACLDDAKRNVRVEAVKCRTAWLALDEADEEES